MLVDPSCDRRTLGPAARHRAAHRRREANRVRRSSDSCCPYPARTALVVAAGRSQIGEFSFILGQTGVALGLLDARAVLADPGRRDRVDHAQSVRAAPGRAGRALAEATAARCGALIDRHGADPPLPEETLTNHVVIVGCGRVGRHIAEALGRLGIPRLVVEVDPIAHRQAAASWACRCCTATPAAPRSWPTRRSSAPARWSITLPDDAAALAVVATARMHAPELHIVARASTWEGGRRLATTGADERRPAGARGRRRDRPPHAAGARPFRPRRAASTPSSSARKVSTSPSGRAATGRACCTT